MLDDAVLSSSWWWHSSDAPLSLDFWTRFTVSGDDCPYFCCPPAPSDKNPPHRRVSAYAVTFCACDA